MLCYEVRLDSLQIERDSRITKAHTYALKSREAGGEAANQQEGNSSEDAVNFTACFTCLLRSFYWTLAKNI